MTNDEYDEYYDKTIDQVVTDIGALLDTISDANHETPMVGTPGDFDAGEAYLEERAGMSNPVAAELLRQGTPVGGEP